MILSNIQSNCNFIFGQFAVARKLILMAELSGRQASLFSFFGMELLWDDINHISKDRFGWIALNVIFQGRKGQMLPFLGPLDLLPWRVVGRSVCLSVCQHL